MKGRADGVRLNSAFSHKNRKTFTPLFGLNTQFSFPLNWGREGQNRWPIKKGFHPPSGPDSVNSFLPALW